MSDASIQRPGWLPKYLPELDGLRGLAILAVVLYHSNPRLVGTWIYGASLWGWAGVILFFVLSGFLITSILITTRDQPRALHNFHARRALRIWPVYILLLIVVYLNAPWFIGPSVWEAIKTAPWWAYILCVQNLFHLALPPAIQPTWALAIEEQFYFVWAPLVRWLRAPWMIAVTAATMLVASPALRHANLHWMTPTNTLIHLDGIAWGSLLAIGLHTLPLGRRAWLGMGLGGFVLGFLTAGTIAGGTAYLDSALAVGFAGATLTAIASTGEEHGAELAGRVTAIILLARPFLMFWGSVGVLMLCLPQLLFGRLRVLLCRGPLAFYGRISYGLYLMHISVFIFIGSFDAAMDRHGYGIAGNLAVVAMRLLVSTLVAAALWYGFESQILKLKKHF